MNKNKLNDLKKNIIGFNTIPKDLQHALIKKIYKEHVQFEKDVKTGRKCPIAIKDKKNIKNLFKRFKIKTQVPIQSCFWCSFGHQTGCHYPNTCSDSVCGHPTENEFEEYTEKYGENYIDNNE